MKHLIKYALLLLVISSAKICSMEMASESYESKNPLKHKLNRVLNIHGGEPIYLITVTRSIGNCEHGCALGGVHNNRGIDTLTPADWLYVKNVLSDLCKGVGAIAHLNHATPSETALHNYITANINSLRSAGKIVVFNEAFFRKTHLTAAERDLFLNGAGGGAILAADSIIGLSNICGKTIFYPNFLYARNYNNPADIAILNRYNNVSYDPIIGQDLHVNFSFGALPAHAGIPGHIVENSTYGINSGEILTKYKKRSYFQEADNDIQHNGYIYDFGTGFDEAVYAGHNVRLQNLRGALLSHVRVEICLDLNTGVRHSNGWNNLNKDANLLILQSNCIDPLGTIDPTHNINHLPKSTYKHNINILYADPIYSNRIGSNLFRIDESGAPILFRKEMNNTATLLYRGQDHAIIEMSVYRLD